MTLVTLTIEAHHPHWVSRSFPAERLRRLVAGEPVIRAYFDEELNQRSFLEACKRCYQPLLSLIKERVEASRGEGSPFKVNLSLSGLFLENVVKYEPKLIDILKELAASKLVEFTSTTHYHSLASLQNDDFEEFKQQVLEHAGFLERLLGFKPTIFTNTGLIYSDSLGRILEEGDLKGVVVDWAAPIAPWSPPTRVYAASTEGRLRLLIRHRALSDDIALRFSLQGWSEYPLTSQKYVGWLKATGGDVINLYLPAETFGLYHPPESGVFDFLSETIQLVTEAPNLQWATLSEVAEAIEPAGRVSIPDSKPISCVGEGQDLTPWLGNPMQVMVHQRLAGLAPHLREIGNRGLTRIWRLLQQSTLLRCLSLDAVGGSFLDSPYGSPFEAYTTLDAILADFEGSVGLIVQRLRKEREAAKAREQQAQTRTRPTSRTTPPPYGRVRPSYGRF
jgi:alpha-amylase